MFADAGINTREKKKTRSVLKRNERGKLERNILWMSKQFLRCGSQCRISQLYEIGIIREIEQTDGDEKG